MALTITTPNTLLGTFQPDTRTARIVTNLLSVVLGSLLLAASARVSVPVMPVPVTLQTFAAALLAAVFGWRVAAATVTLYLVEGLAGLPVFATGGGIDYLLRPSFGFILGLLPMVLIIGAAADRGLARNPFVLFAVALAADAVCFLFGFGWLLAVAGTLAGQGTALPSWLHADDLVGTAFAGAVQPFLVWDIVKMAFAAATASGALALAFQRD